MQMRGSYVLHECPSNWPLPDVWYTSPLLQFHIILVQDHRDAASEGFTTTNVPAQRVTFDSSCNFDEEGS